MISEQQYNKVLNTFSGILEDQDLLNETFYDQSEHTDEIIRQIQREGYPIYEADDLDSINFKVNVDFDKNSGRLTDIFFERYDQLEDEDKETQDRFIGDRQNYMSILYDETVYVNVEVLDDIGDFQTVDESMAYSYTKLMEICESEYDSILEGKPITRNMNELFGEEAFEASINEGLPVQSVEDVLENVEFDVDVHLQTTSDGFAQRFIERYFVDRLDRESQDAILEDTSKFVELYFEEVTKQIDNGNFTIKIQTTPEEFKENKEMEYTYDELLEKVSSQFESIIEDKQAMSDYFKDDFLGEAFEAALAEELPVQSIEDVEENVDYDVEFDLQTSSETLAEMFIDELQLDKDDRERQDRAIKEIGYYFEIISEVIDSGGFNMVINTTPEEYNEL